MRLIEYPSGIRSVQRNWMNEPDPYGWSEGRRCGLYYLIIPVTLMAGMIGLALVALVVKWLWTSWAKTTPRRNATRQRAIRSLPPTG